MDLSFTSMYPELNTVLQRIREILFIDIFKHRPSPLVCAYHVQLLQSSLSHKSDKIPIACFKVDKYLEKPNDLGELKKLTIKETKGNREI
jgi:hypothetical protein